MRRDLTAAGATLAAGVLVLTMAAATTASAATPQKTQADAALRYLYAQVGADGSVAGSLGATEDVIISVADSGYDPATLKSSSTATTSYSYLAGKASSVNTAGGAAKYVLAYVAAGKPSALASSASTLLGKLNTPTGSGGYLGANGSFHNADPTVETANSYSQALAVLADVASGTALPANATGWLTCAQRSDGGFGYTITDATSTPPASCGDTSSDTNDTGIILQALGAAGVSTANASAKTFLHAAQQADGGFSFGSTGSSDPDSDSVVIQGLAAVGEDPTSAAWTKGSANPVTNMESFADPKGSGGYVFPGNAAPDAFTTSGIPQALVFKPYAASTTVVAGSTPPAAAPAATPTPTPAASASATPAAAVPVPATGSAAGGAGMAALALAAAGGAIILVAGIVLRGRRSAAL